MAGYDWAAHAERLERENADLRRQLDAQWDWLNTLCELLTEAGVDLGDDRLRQHVIDRRAIGYMHQAQVRDLSRFRREIVSAMHIAEDFIAGGGDEARAYRTLSRSIKRSNQAALRVLHAKPARQRATREVIGAIEDTAQHIEEVQEHVTA